MKKLVLLFVVLVAVVLIVGACSRRKDASQFAAKEVTTVVTPAEDTPSKPLSVTPGSRATDAGTLAVTSLTDNKLETNTRYHVIRGSAPANTHSIQVNGYTLRRYNPGSRHWNYLAATIFGTLKPGQNDYTVRALDAKGQEIATTSFAITYTVAAATLPGTGSPLMATLIMTALIALGRYGFRRFAL